MAKNTVWAVRWDLETFQDRGMEVFSTEAKALAYAASLAKEWAQNTQLPGWEDIVEEASRGSHAEAVQLFDNAQARKSDRLDELSVEGFTVR